MGVGYLVFDTETSGLFDWSKRAHEEGQPRLASYAFLYVDDDLEIEDRVYSLVKPDGWEMSPEAERINGLSMERLVSEGLTVHHALRMIREAIADGRTLVAHNLSYDAKIMRGELRRAGFSDEGCGKGICTMQGLTQACQIPALNGRGFKWPKLAEACRIILKRELPGAHNALVDAKACLWLLRAMAERGLLEKKEAA